MLGLGLGIEIYVVLEYMQGKDGIKVRVRLRIVLGLRDICKV